MKDLPQSPEPQGIVRGWRPLPLGQWRLNNNKNVYFNSLDLAIERIDCIRLGNDGFYRQVFFTQIDSINTLNSWKLMGLQISFYVAKTSNAN